MKSINHLSSFLLDYNTLVFIVGIFVLLTVASLFYVLFFWRKRYYSENTNLAFKVSRVGIVFFGLIVISAITGTAIAAPKIISPKDPSLGISAVSHKSPVVLEFDRPIYKKNLKYSIAPEAKGSWAIQQNYLTGQSKLVFTPTSTLLLDTRYTILVEGIKNIFGKKQNYMFSFQTPPKPTVAIK